MVTKTGGFVVPLMVAGGASVLGAFAYLVIVPDIAPLVPKHVPRKAVRRPA